VGWGYFLLFDEGMLVLFVLLRGFDILIVGFGCLLDYCRKYWFVRVLIL